MKKILFFSLMMLGITGSAQLTVVKDVSTTGLRPTDNEHFIWQNNRWNGKHYYGVTVTPSVAIAVTDGTDAGTKVIKNLGHSGVLSAEIKAIIPAKDHFYIHVYVYKSWSPYVQYDELWKSDGTDAGTVLLKRFDERGVTTEGISITTDQYEAANRSLSGNEMYFYGYTGSNGRKIWKTDGTAAGTSMIADKSGNALTRLNNDVYFASDFKLWKISGTTGSVELIDVPNIFIVATMRMAAFKNKLYFMGFDETNGVELWSSDGTPSGTKIFTNTSPLTNNVYSLTTFNLTSTDDYLLFSTLHNASVNTRHTLYRTDGTLGGTVQISPADAIDAGTSSGSMFSKTNENFYCFNMSQKTIFRTNYQENGYSIASTGAYNAGNLVDYKGTAWYAGGTASMSGNNDFAEPHRTDGVQTVKTFDIITLMQGTNNIGSNPFGFHELNGNLYFFAGLGNAMKLYQFQGDYTFNRSTGNSWNAPANWNTGVVPLSSEDTLVPAGSDVEISSAASARNLALNAPLHIVSGSLNLAGDLNLNSRITLNNNALNLRGTSSNITGGNTNNYIVTNGTGTVNVENVNAGRGTVNLPVGTANNYNPLTLANSGTSDTFSVKVSEGIANAPGGAVNATWDISEGTPGGSNATISLGWNASQQNGTFNPNNATVGHYVNGAWTAENSGAVSGSNPYTITGTGITSFSPFAVMNLGALATADPLKKNITVYPNPFREILTVTSEDKATVHFYDMSGKMVGSHALVKGTNALNPAALKPGVYLYQVKNTSGNVMASGKVIKK